MRRNLLTVVSWSAMALLCLLPRDKQPLAASVLDVIKERKWLVTDLHNDPGRLDDMFREVTTTEDVA